MRSDFRTTTAKRPMFAAVAALGCLLSSTSYGWFISGTVKSAAGANLDGVSVTVVDTTTIKTTTAGGAFTLEHTVGIQTRDIARGSTAWIDGSDLVIEGLTDGSVDLSIVNASGRSLWTANTVSNQGVARTTLPSNLARNAIFLRVGTAQGTQIHAISVSPSGIAITRTAGRAMAAFPVLEFTLAGYNKTTYTMTSERQTGVAITMTPTDPTCPLPTTFKWKDFGGPVAGPKNGWTAIKDFTHVSYNGKHYVYMTYYLNGWNAAQMAPFTDWSEAKNMTQTKTNTGVAPELMYFTPKKTWIMSKQWCSGASFCWMESTNIDNGSSFAQKGNLLTETITDDKKAPIDQTLICDDSKCYIFYADDNGRIYRGSMPKANFPGLFTGTTKILQDTQARLFEAVQVYKIKGQKQYLMIVECMSPRYFRAFTATDLGGTWSPLANATTQAVPFAGKNNVSGIWSDDISHGDLVRSTYDEYREVDACNLQLIYQGYKGPFSGEYGNIPYQMGLLTYTK